MLEYKVPQDLPDPKDPWGKLGLKESLVPLDLKAQWVRRDL